MKWRRKRRSNHKERGRWITAILVRDGDDCPLCNEPLDRRIRDEASPLYVTFDHIIPRSRGGLDQIDNLRLTHKVCNERRGAGDAAEVAAP